MTPDWQSPWIFDYVFAFVFGILFQYFTITPMKKLSRKEGLKQALKADSLSLTAWQVGMSTGGSSAGASKSGCDRLVLRGA
jgi:hypothetical protein